MEDTMFFPKLRSHAKWVFILLAIVFATSFVFLGVGSGSSGLGDLLNGNFGNLFGSGSGTSAQIDKDQKRIDKNPKDYAAYKDMAAAQASDDKIDAAIATLVKLKAVAPKDVDGLTQLASLYVRKADDARLAAVNAQAEAQGTAEPVRIRAGRDVPRSARSSRASPRRFRRRSRPARARSSTTPTTKMTAAYSQAVGAYQDVAKVNPNDPSIQFALAQTAEQATDTKTAIAAYKRFLKLAPEDPTAPAIRQRIKQLKQQAQLPTVSTG